MNSWINSENATVQVEFQKFQSKVEADLQKVKDDFTNLFHQMKKSFTAAISNLKEGIDKQTLATRQTQSIRVSITTSQVN